VSDEYILQITLAIGLQDLTLPIEQLGLQQVTRTAEKVAFAYPSMSPPQVARWGGNVILEQHPAGGVMLTLNAVSPRLVLASISDHVALLGGTIAADEL
jgi:hypothetical protein